MKTLIKRNVKMFFKDKGLFFTSLITPVILLVLYATFLGNVYKDSFSSGLPGGVEISEKLMNGLVGGQLISSILAVSCVTVSFCSNMLMVQDKSSGALRDFTVSPVKGTTLALSYYVASFASTLLICFAGMGICLIYIAVNGWFMSAVDVVFLAFDVFILVLFGTALSSVVNHFMSTQGQISAVGTIVSSGYGFICGAYMPISQFSPLLQKIISFLPGTYGTSLVRNHSLRGAVSALKEEGVPEEAVKELCDVMDCNLYFFETQVSIGGMYTVVVSFSLVLLFIYACLTGKREK